MSEVKIKLFISFAEKIIDIMYLECLCEIYLQIILLMDPPFCPLVAWWLGESVWTYFCLLCLLNRNFA